MSGGAMPWVKITVTTVGSAFTHVNAYNTSLLTASSLVPKLVLGLGIGLMRGARASNSLLQSLTDNAS
jgi:hypothetical protein